MPIIETITCVCGHKHKKRPDKRSRSAWSHHLNDCDVYQNSVKENAREEMEDERNWRKEDMISKLSGIGFTDDQINVLADIFTEGES